jgi:hypothetical protein
VIPLTSLFALLRNYAGAIHGALVVGVLTYAVALAALVYLEETFKKDLNYTETVE